MTIAVPYAESKATRVVVLRPAQADRDGERGHGDQGAGPGDRVVDAAGDACVLVRCRREHRRGEGCHQHRQAETEQRDRRQDAEPVAAVGADASSATASRPP